MTFVKEAALACLAVLTGFTKTKAISNKTDGPAKKALANLLYVGIAVGPHMRNSMLGLLTRTSFTVCSAAVLLQK
jgi:hypothetical protein